MSKGGKPNSLRPATLGRVLYEMPLTNLAPARKRAKYLVVFCAVAIAIWIYELMVALWQGGVAYFAAEMILLGFVSIIIAQSARAALIHDRLTIYERGIVPLRRPFGTPPDIVLPLEQIERIVLSTMPGRGSSFFEYNIYDRRKRRYRVNSTALMRYDRSPFAEAVVRSGLEHLRLLLGENDSKTEPSAAPVPPVP